MEKRRINCDIILKIESGISTGNEPEDIVVLVVDSIQQALPVKKCTLFLYNRKTKLR